MNIGSNAIKIYAQCFLKIIHDRGKKTIYKCKDSRKYRREGNLLYDEFHL